MTVYDITYSQAVCMKLLWNLCELRSTKKKKSRQNYYHHPKERREEESQDGQSEWSAEDWCQLQKCTEARERKGLPVPPPPPCHLIPPSLLIQTPGGGGEGCGEEEEGGGHGAHVSRNSHAVGQQRVTVTPSTADQARRYVKSSGKRTHTHSQRHNVAVGRGSGLAGWILEQSGAHREGLCFLFYCTYSAARLKCGHQTTTNYELTIITAQSVRRVAKATSCDVQNAN